MQYAITPHEYRWLPLGIHGDAFTTGIENRGSEVFQVISSKEAHQQ